MTIIDPRPSFVVHDWKQVALVLAAAREARRAVQLFTPVGAAYTSGVGFWAAIVRRITELFPDVDVRLAIDCDDAPGHVLAALRMEHRWIVFNGNEAARKRLLDIAGQSGAALVDRPTDIVDCLRLARPQIEIAARLAVA